MPGVTFPKKEISMKRTTRIFLMVLALMVAGSCTAFAAQWSSTAVSFLYGSGYELTSEEDASIMTLEHASGWAYGDNFFFFDVFQPIDDGTGIYGEWHPRLSFGKMFGKDMSFGPIKDVLIATEVNMSNDWRALLYGIGFDLNIPHFNFFSINFMIRDSQGAFTTPDETTFQISPAWNVPFDIGSMKWSFGGFLDYYGAEGDGDAEMLAQPQLLLDVGNFSDKPGNLYVGIEYQYFMNKYGSDIDESLVQFMGKWVF